VFRLQAPTRYRLTRAPLAQALVQVRFPLIARIQSAEGIAPIQERLRDRYPYMAQRQEVALQITPGPTGPTPGVVGGLAWELTDDGGRMAVISTGSATLTVGSAYEGVDDFAERLEQILSVLGEEAGVPRCDRLGVRYLSVAETPPGGETSWREWFRPELTGWVASNLLDDQTVPEVALSQIQLRAAAEGPFSGLTPDIRCAVQHGLVPGGSGIPGIPPITTTAASYILGLDLSVEAPQAFDAGALRRQFEALHREIDAFFRWSLTPQGEDHFGFEEVS